MDFIAGASPRQLARIAGALYLINIVGGALAIGIVLPRATGLLMAIDGLAYLVYSFVDLSAPGFAARLVPLIQLPALSVEGSLCLRLLVVGVDVERWKERASATIRTRSTPMEALA